LNPLVAKRRVAALNISGFFDIALN
jgi:hypothetical protein